ncbi:MAG: hypothetical protein FWG65_13425 [Turicibacter sp.]|nr:hypothetical protein [Turicibacter sp.]
MEFVFGNSGTSYGLLYQDDNPRTPQISEYMQKINNFGTDWAEPLFTYKVVSDGLSFTTIFSLYAADNNFDRGAFYNHVKWHKYRRDDFIKADFFDEMLSDFANQDDINALRESGDINRTAGSGTYDIKSDILHKVIHILHSEKDKKIAVAFALDNNDNNGSGGQFEIFRQYAKQIFTYLPIGLRTTTSFVTSCDTETLLKSDYRLGLIALSSVSKRNEGKLVIVEEDGTEFDAKDDLAEYVEWIVGVKEESERDKFFEEYENVVKGKIGNVESLLGCYKSYINPEVEEEAPEITEVEEVTEEVEVAEPKEVEKVEEVLKVEEVKKVAESTEVEPVKPAPKVAEVKKVAESTEAKVSKAEKTAEVPKVAESTKAEPVKPAPMSQKQELPKSTPSPKPQPPPKPAPKPQIKPQSAAPQPQTKQPVAQPQQQAPLITPQQPPQSVSNPPQIAPQNQPQPYYGNLQVETRSRGMVYYFGLIIESNPNNWEIWTFGDENRNWGMWTFGDGSRYIGEFEHIYGNANGWGVMISPDNDYRAGKWVNGAPFGKRIEKMKGIFKNELPRNPSPLKSSNVIKANEPERWIPDDSGRSDVMTMASFDDSYWYVGGVSGHSKSKFGYYNGFGTLFEYNKFRYGEWKNSSPVMGHNWILDLSQPKN